MIRGVVTVYKDLATEFMNYKEYVAHELRISELIVEGKEKEIEHQKTMMKDYEAALRIPRNHFKHLEKLRYEEVMEQRDKIVAKLIKKFGFDPTLPGAVPVSKMEIAKVLGLSAADAPGKAVVESKAPPAKVDVA